MGRIVVTWLLFVLTAGFCWSPFSLHAAGTRGQIAGEAALQKGVELYEDGKTEEALSLLRGFVIRHYDSPFLSEAYLYMARIFQDRGQPGEALLYIARIPATQRGPEAQLVEGASLVATDETERGVAILQTLEKANLTEADRLLRFSSLAEGNARLGRLLQALFFIHQGLSLPGESEGLLHKAHILLKDRLSDQDLAETAFMFSGTPLGADASLQLASRTFARGDEEEALRQVKTLLHSPVSFPYRRDAVHLFNQLTGKPWLQRAVGVVLPLTGRYATFGKLVRRGMELALQIHNEDKPPVRFIFKDTNGDPEQSVRALLELVDEERVMAVAGPLTGATALVAATRAQEVQVPLLTLSHREGLPEAGDFVFRNSLTSRLQVQALAKYAIEEQKMVSFGILYPENRLGQEMAELFTEEVESYGGMIKTVQSYGENATDFGRQIKLLMGKDPDAPEEETPPPGAMKDFSVSDEPEPSAVDFDALFIPDYADRVGLIAPQLAYYGIEEIPLLGINGWNSPELIRIAGRYVEGAVFTDGFFRYSHYPFVKEFVNLYYEKYGEEPFILEAQGFDVAGILLSLLDRSDVQTREDFRVALAQIQNYPGVTGATTFNHLGDAEKVLFLLQVRNGDIVQIN
jgi:branched-chain amino acid transport system substrate-binding protein